MRLWLRVTLIMCLVAVVPVVLTGALALQASHRTERVRTEEAVTTEAIGMATLAAAWIDTQDKVAETWTSAYDRDEVVRAGVPGMLGHMQAIYRAIDGAYLVVWLDDTVAEVPPPVHLGPGQAQGSGEFADRRRVGADELAWGLARFAPGGPEGWTLLDGPGGEPLIRLVLRSNGYHLGVLLDAAPLLRHVRSSGADAWALHDPAGATLHSGEPSLEAALGLGPAAGQRGVQRWWHDEQTALATVSLDEPAWYLTVARVHEAAAASGLILTETLAVVVLALGVVMLLGVALRLEITRPVQALMRDVGLVAEGDYGRKLEWARLDELGDLARAFDDLSESLAEHEQENLAQAEEIRAFNRDLQDMVEERTRELKEAQAELVQAGQFAAIAEVSAGLAHELNNPLASILGYLQLIRSGAEPSPAILEILETEAQRCRTVLAAMARFGEGRVDATGFERVPLDEVLHEQVARHRPTFERRGVSVTWVRPPQGCVVKSDRMLLDRLLLSALEALRAGLGAGSSLRIELASSDGAAQVSFACSVPLGQGSAGDDWQAAGSQVWLSRRLADLLGGSLTEKDGAGTTWVLELPEG